MGRILNTDKKRLQWFLRFINVDIDSRTDQQMFNLWIELREMIYGSLGVLAITPDDLRHWEDKKNRTKEIQSVLRESLKKILATSALKKKTMIRPRYRWDEEEERAYQALESEKDIGSLFTVGEDIARLGIEGKPLPQWPQWVQAYVAKSHTLEVHILADKDNVLPFFPKPEDKLLLEFTSLLQRFSLSSIRKCQREDCGAYFLKATKKEKRYCSNKCAWVMASRERRKVQPEKEREKKRESYYQRKRREIGPKVKVHRRPRREG